MAIAQKKTKRAHREDEESTPKKHNKSIHDRLTGQNYGMAGCGLGSVIFGDNNNRGVQLLAGTTNGTYSNNTFGVSSGTSNCTAESSPNSADTRKNMINFISANKQELETDVSKNGGETVNTLATIMKIEDKKEFSAKLQKNYSTIFKNSEPSDIANAILELI
ncbi:MAG: DUF3015 family protein [Bacteriovoracaceae bacterium]